MPSTPLNPKPHKWQFEAIGTFWSIETTAPLSEDIQSTISDRIEVFDQAYSRFRDDSIVTAMAQKAGQFIFPTDVIDLIAFYRRLYDTTDGAVTPLIGGALSSAGYDKDYTFVSSETLEPVPVWDDVMTWADNVVTTTRPLTLDVGAAGKGYIVDKIGELLEQNGVGEYVIDASGDVRHRGNDTQRIGLENPYDASSVIGIADVQNTSLCASATNRRQWGNGMHHVFDPRTLAPVRDVAATWVVADTTMLADGLATALFFVDEEILCQTWDFQYVRLMGNGKIVHSDDFVGELFI